MVRSTTTCAGVLVAALLISACGSSSSKSHKAGHATRPSRIYRLSLSGSAEVPRGAPHGSGAAILAWHGETKVCWRFAHLHGFSGATVAHIHAGSKGRSGKIVLPLSTGTRLHHEGCVPISPTLTKAIWRDPSRYYVNIHSTQYPAGAVRAQL